MKRRGFMGLVASGLITLKARKNVMPKGKSILFVDPVHGNDENDGLSCKFAKRSIKHACTFEGCKCIGVIRWDHDVRRWVLFGIPVNGHECDKYKISCMNDGCSNFQT